VTTYIIYVISAQYAIAHPPVSPSICPPQGIDQSKKVEIMIMQFSPYSSHIPQVFVG